LIHILQPAKSNTMRVIQAGEIDKFLRVSLGKRGNSEDGVVKIRFGLSEAAEESVMITVRELLNLIHDTFPDLSTDDNLYVIESSYDAVFPTDSYSQGSVALFRGKTHVCEKYYDLTKNSFAVKIIN
jgi:hypothetical protein